jgi:regulatory protein
MGPFRTGPEGPEARRRDLAALARAGFSREIAERALATEPNEAEQRIGRLRLE